MKALRLLIVLFLAWANAATAAVIYTNGGMGSSGFLSDLDLPSFAADDFVLAPGANVITDLHWTGVYALTNTPQATDNFRIQIFANVAGNRPDITALQTIVIGTANRTDTGINVSNNFDLYSYSANVAPITLAAGTTFWLSIFNDTTVDTNDDWFWGMEPDVGNSFFKTAVSWAAAGHRHDFDLTNDVAVVPEPSALALLALGVGLLGWRQRQAR